MDKPTVRPVKPSDREWVRRFLRARWGSERMVGHGDVFSPADQSGFLVQLKDKPVGLAAYAIVDDSCEITFIDSGVKHAGIGTVLMEAIETMARQAGCKRLWLVTTNDNLDALRFYQRRGFVLVRLRPDVMASYRQLKPELPLIGDFGIPLRDELELHKLLI